MYPQATLETTHAPLEMALEETHEVRGAGTFQDIGAVIDAAIPVITKVVDAVS